ncbi:hypothetical protein A6M27_05710 [Acidithiobacillus thiooxidans]|uniref:Putative zinc-finger domain-containing protein n=1 Tax=Acidithiobacillus thiooxidans TaxID=930 RepID=A0A1C2JAE1_ACITH|nr:zf-HC2 domain-containing protein [Acidithiobacillus thiooxidans]OCX74425.1 hypothetical protein A6P07_05605 [Acidithiobacillus thiooxidans]OCX77442.1 hypothetical protein A6O24_06705 [Acidithiobacillus thiooxidans]OCX85219.1 hypothetical protein A6O26_01890 [Acidithiobacillus thiooxidans]OCX88785.1 hypothetical protein A6M27_05710 [Acidithiobacillus thiooxidans]OFC42949.1 hypothetical protein BAE47_13990 [Acidithiobacillus thiooxidans]
MKKRLMLTCQDASKLLSKGQEQTLPFRERWALKIHLFFCVSCRNYARQIGWIDQVFHLIADRWNTYHLSHEAKERIRDMLKKVEPGLGCDHSEEENHL